MQEKHLELPWVALETPVCRFTSTVQPHLLFPHLHPISAASSFSATTSRSHLSAVSRRGSRAGRLMSGCRRCHLGWDLPHLTWSILPRAESDLSCYRADVRRSAVSHLRRSWFSLNLNGMWWLISMRGLQSAQMLLWAARDADPMKKATFTLLFPIHMC